MPRVRARTAARGSKRDTGSHVVILSPANAHDAQPTHLDADAQPKHTVGKASHQQVIAQVKILEAAAVRKLIRRKLVAGEMPAGNTSFLHGVSTTTLAGSKLRQVLGAHRFVSPGMPPNVAGISPTILLELRSLQ